MLIVPHLLCTLLDLHQVLHHALLMDVEVQLHLQRRGVAKLHTLLLASSRAVLQHHIHLKLELTNTKAARLPFTVNLMSLLSQLCVKSSTSSFFSMWCRLVMLLACRWKVKLPTTRASTTQLSLPTTRGF